jgi:YD repeat-containing protein
LEGKFLDFSPPAQTGSVEPDHDCENRLISAGSILTYSYDLLGRRIRRKLLTYSDVRYVWENLRGQELFQIFDGRLTMDDGRLILHGNDEKTEDRRQETE